MKTTKLLSSLILFFVISVIIYSCSCSSCGKKEEANIPLDILNKANAFVISKTGEVFFNDYITPDFTKIKHTPPYYEMFYRMYIPEKPYVNTKIYFTVDTTGNVVEKNDIFGIPECVKSPSKCNWQIDKSMAIEIAKKNNLEEGVKDWQVGFIWNPERKIYVWHILSTIREFEGDFGYRGSGKEMIINPVTGELLAVNDWHIR